MATFQLVNVSNLVSAKSIKQNKNIQVCENNKVAFNTIPDTHKNLGYEELVLFLENHPLHYTFFWTLV